MSPADIGVAAQQPPDLRLVGAAVGVWAAAAVALHGGAARAGGLAAVLALGTTALSWRYVAARPRRWWLGLLTATVGGAAVGAAVTGLRVAERDAAPIVAAVAARTEVTAALVVADDPRPLGAGVPTGGSLVPARLERVRFDDGAMLRLRARVVVFSRAGWGGLLPGQRLTARVRFGAARPGDLTAAALTAVDPPHPHGAAPWAQRAAGALRAGLTSACAPLPDEPGGLLPGLAIGDTRTLPATVVADFRTTGLTHLVAVSGSNVAIIVGAVLCVGRWCRAGPRWCAAVCLVALVGFVILVRPSPSVLRAGLMGAVGLLALAGGRAAVAAPALAATVIGLVLLDPGLATHPGFLLSVSATAALVLLAPRWSAALRRRGVPRGLAEALAVPAAAQAACGPTVAAIAGAVNPVAVLANLLAAPAVAPATVLGVAAAVTGPAAPEAASAAVWLAQWPAWWLVQVARLGAQVPGAALPWPSGWPGALLLAALTAALLLAGRRRAVRRVAAAVTAAAMVGAVPVRLVASGWPPAGWLVVACDVGQGDALVLPAGPRAAVVVDAGPEPVGVDRCLRGLGVRRVRVLLLSHFHADHVGGVAGVARRRGIDAVAGPPPVDGAAGWRHVRATLRRPPEVARPGWTYRSGPLAMTVLGTGAPLRGTRSDANNNSLVLSATVHGVRVLLAGDAEVEQQHRLLDTRRGALRARVLKVAHHGSAHQAPAFLDAVRPEVALISAGAGNRYGHPHPAVLAALRRAGARTARTDVDGDIAVVVQAGRLAVAVRGRATQPT